MATVQSRELLTNLGLNALDLFLRSSGAVRAACDKHECTGLGKAWVREAGLILAQKDDAPLKWANGPYPIQMHANFQILMGHLKF